MIKSKILSQIKPSESEHEEFEKVVLKFKRKLKRAANKLEIKCDFFVGGSFGKGTYLKGTFDVDIFSRFDLSYDDSKLSEYLEAILVEAKIKNYKLQKGSRDYFSVLFGPRNLKVLFEVIPNRKIRKLSDATNSTDYSPRHLDYLKKKISENPGLADEIRLAKQFFKAHELYGAESYINGFSGHVIDILIAFYGSLEALLEAAKNWEESVFIDINSFYSGMEDGLDKMDNSKHSSLVLVDPILKDRNAARALDEEKYSEFILIAQKFVGFKESDFHIHKPEVDEVVSNAREFAKKANLQAIMYKFRIKLKGESEDICGAKMLKLHKKTKKFFLSYDYKLFRDEFFIDISAGYCLFIFLFEKGQLPAMKKVEGPKVFMKEAVEKFLEKRGDYFIENGRVCVYEDRAPSNLKFLSKLSLEDFEKFLTRDISFVKSVRRLL